MQLTGHARPGASAPVELTRRLARELDDRGIRYCHWKSNLAIAKSESAENDLDLLLDRGDEAALVSVLDELGFTRTVLPGGEVPDTASYYAFAPDGGRWVNVHVHYRLVLGHDRSKNHRMPIEELFLRSSAPTASFLPTPPAELEYIVLVVRLVLKYAIADEIAWSALRGKRAEPKKSEKAELEDLRARVDHDEVRRWLAEPGMPDAGLFADCERALLPSTGLAERVRTAGRLEEALGGEARRSRAADLGARVHGRVDLAARRRTGRLRGNRRVAGGMVVAVIGGDGSGKTTLIASLTDWLQGAFEIRQIHMGKPTWSTTTKVVRGSLAAADRALRLASKVVGRRATQGPRSWLETWRPVVWYALTARDRKRLHAEARRFVADGGIVVSDRWPHHKLVEMDVPQIRRIVRDRPMPSWARRLADYEERAHASITAPDVLIVLRLDPEIAVIRKVEETAESVRRRGQEIFHADWSDTDAHVIEATHTPEEVAAQARAVVSAALP